jgi:hypothetical protein
MSRIDSPGELGPGLDTPGRSELRPGYVEVAKINPTQLFDGCGSFSVPATAAFAKAG